MRILFDTTMATSERALDALSLAQETIARNIANVETPGFRASEVTFQDELADALSRERAAQRSGALNDRFAVDEAVPCVVPRAGGAARRDGNSVDIDREMTTLAQTSILYSTLAQLLATKFSMIASAIRWGQ
jgi:flagellar basal-body rod protein FlgB